MSPTNPFDDKGELKASSTHGKFARDMALRTVINKVAKFIINASSDNALLLERINQAEDIADAAVVQEEIEEKANTGTLIMIPDDGKPQLEAAKDPVEDKEATKAELPEKKPNGEQVRAPGF